MASRSGILASNDIQAIDDCINRTEISLCRCYGRGEIVWQPAHNRFVVFGYKKEKREGSPEGAYYLTLDKGIGNHFGYIDSLNFDTAKEGAIKYYNDLPLRE